jgi:putative transposase
MSRVYRYRLYPTAAQAGALAHLLGLLRFLYNACLQERRDAWKKQGVSLTRRTQDQQLRAVRDADPDYAAIHFHLLQDMVTRCDRAFQAFFRRCKSREKPGFPRFKGRDFFKSFTFKDAGHRNGAALCAGGKRLRIHGIGNVKIRLHREHEGKLKQVRIIRLGDGKWYADFVCVEVPAKPLPRVEAEVGVDLGITTFAALSNGLVIENPRYFEVGQAALAKAQQKVARRGRRSNRRRKARRVVAKHHLKVARQRRDFQHKTALQLVRDYQTIFVEDLNVKGLASGMLAKQVNDVAWGQFIEILASKAESAGREVMKVDPRGTSQRCSACGGTVQKPLSVRVHACPCGYVADRDINAAKNVLRLGQSLREARRAAA